MPSHKHVVFSYKKVAQCSERDIAAVTKQLKEYTLHLRAVAKRADYTAIESSIHAPFDTATVSTVKKMAQEKKTKHLKFIIVVGIGGSQLGTKAIYEALYGVNGMSHGKHPAVIFLDTTDPRLFDEVSGLFGTHIKSPDQFLMVVVTKSGTTTETIADFEALAAVASQKLGDIHN
jgi:glucose-6-phosphate isomerase